jgi:hypothetical protein
MFFNDGISRNQKTNNIPWIIALFLMGSQVLCDLLGSVTVFPIVHYGMYSQPIVVSDQYQSYELVVNGKVLEGSDYRIHLWENILAPLQDVDRISNTTDFQDEKNTIERIFYFLGMQELGLTLRNRMDNMPFDAHLFGQHYKKYLSEVLGIPISNLKVFRIVSYYADGGYFNVQKELIVHE